MVPQVAAVEVPLDFLLPRVGAATRASIIPDLGVQAIDSDCQISR